MLLIAIASLIESRARGSIFYTQSRVGYGGRNFNLYKFRSMVEAAEQDGTARWASPDDDRVTPLGKILRRYRLDELYLI
jgi:lipopolysaccharide/colanic/teichoic acid biosynthesis glycosyltransferase